MGEVIVITSGKGGVGKTTTTANIGAGLATLGKKVVVIDTDLGLRNLDVVMGLENRIVYNLVDVIEGNCRMKQALIKDKRYENLYLLPSAQTKDKTAVSPEQVQKLTEELAEDLYDIYDEALDEVRDGLREFPETEVEIYIYKNKLACINMVMDDMDTEVELLFKGGDFRAQNMELTQSKLLTLWAQLKHMCLSLKRNLTCLRLY